MLIQPILAYTLIERESLKLDESLYVKDQELYAFPEKILLNRIVSPNEEFKASSEAWIDLLYYHFITRLQFADLPYNYLIDRNGDIYQGRAGWEGSIPELAVQEGAILVGYLSNGSDITAPADKAFKELVESLSFKYGIKADGVEVVDLQIATKEEGKLSKLSYEPSISIFAEEMEGRISSYKYSEKDNITINAGVSDVVVPESVNAGEKFEVSLKVENSGETPWFTVNDFIYVATASGKDSQFAVNGEWDSFDTPTHIEGKTIFPGDTQEVKFNMKAPFFPGEYSETFGIKRLDDSTVIGGTSFEVKVKVDKGDLKLVEILDTETGALKVRGTPSYSGAEVAQVPSGSIYIFTESQNGWYKIQYEEGKEGWVLGRYVKEL